ncbi:DUF4056 domain-containing protein [Streptosporangium roseum]|uniref:DUF4056 domain-containing protein n=1 Tax=Streptosporangium roseum TaxID=2001 RepID=UPI003321B602
MADSKTAVPGLLPELSFRPCCLLAEKLDLLNDIPVLGHVWPRIMVDLSGDNLRHVAGTSIGGLLARRLLSILPGVGGPEVSGIVYTCAAGFVDLGHLRDYADLTRHYYYLLTRRAVNGVVKGGTFIPLLETHGGITGQIMLQRDLPCAMAQDLDLLIDVARSISYDLSVMYEIKTYGETRVGGRSSSFSPEDLPSNYLGTYVGAKALKLQLANSRLPQNGGVEPSKPTTFDAAVTRELAALLLRLHAGTREKTIAEFAKIDGRWVTDALILPNFLDTDYILRRNFHVRPIEPWLVQGACVDTDFPEEVDRELPVEATTACQTFYNFTSEFYSNSVFTSTDFDLYIGEIKTDAGNRYGDDFDKP